MFRQKINGTTLSIVRALLGSCTLEQSLSCYAGQVWLYLKHLYLQTLSIIYSTNMENVIKTRWKWPLYTDIQFKLNFWTSLPLPPCLRRLVRMGLMFERQTKHSLKSLWHSSLAHAWKCLFVLTHTTWYKHLPLYGGSQRWDYNSRTATIIISILITFILNIHYSKSAQTPSSWNLWIVIKGC